LATDKAVNQDQGEAFNWDTMDELPEGESPELELGEPMDLESDDAFPPQEPAEVVPAQQPGTEPPTPTDGDQGAGNGSILDQLEAMSPEDRRKAIRQLSYNDEGVDGVIDRLLREEKTGPTQPTVPQAYTPAVPATAPAAGAAPAAPAGPGTPTLTPEQHLEQKMAGFRAANGREPVDWLELTDWSAHETTVQAAAYQENFREARQQVQQLIAKHPDVSQEQITLAVQHAAVKAQVSERNLQPGDIEAGFRAEFGADLEKQAVDKDRKARSAQAQRAAASPTPAPAAPAGEPAEPYTSDLKVIAARAKRKGGFGKR